MVHPPTWMAVICFVSHLNAMRPHSPTLSLLLSPDILLQWLSGIAALIIWNYRIYCSIHLTPQAEGGGTAGDGAAVHHPPSIKGGEEEEEFLVSFNKTTPFAFPLPPPPFTLTDCQWSSFPQTTIEEEMLHCSSSAASDFVEFL